MIDFIGYTFTIILLTMELLKRRPYFMNILENNNFTHHYADKIFIIASICLVLISLTIYEIILICYIIVKINNEELKKYIDKVYNYIYPKKEQ